jgi:hypothetical protein
VVFIGDDGGGHGKAVAADHFTLDDFVLGFVLGFTQPLNGADIFTEQIFADVGFLMAVVVCVLVTHISVTPLLAFYVFCESVEASLTFTWCGAAR